MKSTLARTSVTWHKVLHCKGTESTRRPAPLGIDSNLAGPIRLVKTLGKKVGLINPHERPSATLMRIVNFNKAIRPGVLAASQFPPTLRDDRGTIYKPLEW